jgi:hypothetical protein
MKNNEEHIIELQTLLSRNTDAVKGFKQVAESASNESLQTFCYMNALVNSASKEEMIAE